MGFELASLDTTDRSNAGSKMVLKHPTTGKSLPDGEDGEAFIILRGTDSDAYRDKMLDLQRESLKEDDTDKDDIAKLEDVRERAIKLLAACVVEWHGIDWDGAPLDCTQDNAEKLFKKFTWIKEQVDIFVQDISNFFPEKANG